MNLYGFVGNDGVSWIDLLGLAQIITDQTNGKTYWIPDDCCCENVTEYDSLNKVVNSAKKGANDPYKSDDTKAGKTPAMKGNPKAYGPNDGILTNDPRGRWIHGGGSALGDKGARAPKQPLCATMGCTRMHNEDIQDLADKRRNKEKDDPDEKVPYQRGLYEKGGLPPEVAKCREKFNSEDCVKKRSK
jgi:hypothetical protein